jgi:hypothetical protein
MKRPVAGVCALLFILCLSAVPLSADRTVNAPGVEAALRAAASAVEAAGFTRSFFGTFEGVMRVQGTWPVTFAEKCRSESPGSTPGTTRVSESTKSRSGELILDITASGGSGRVKIKTDLMNPRSSGGSCAVSGTISGGPPKDWEERFFAALERALAAGATIALPAPQARGSSQIAQRYQFDVVVEGGKVRVASVRAGGRAEKAGLIAGDEIVKVFDKNPNRNLDLLVFDMFQGHLTHGALTMTVKGKDGRKREIRIADRF